jgi:hypothetical protein
VITVQERQARGPKKRDTHEEEQRSDAEEARAHDGYDPVYALAGGPSEPEETDGDEEGPDDGDGHALLRFQLAILVVLRLLHVVQVREEGGHDEERADEEAEEGEADELLAPVVDAAKHDREGLEPHVE